MAFVFSLQRLLALRRGRERVERIRLGHATQQLLALRRRMEALQQEIRAAQRDRAAQLGHGLPGGVLHFALQCEATLERQRQLLRQQLLQSEAILQRQREAYGAAQRDMRILQNLRERHWLEYLRDQRRREQTRADDAFLNQKVRRDQQE